MLLPIRASVPCRVLEMPADLRGRDACVFVSYSPEPNIRPHVRFHLDALRDQGLATVLIVNVDQFDKRGRLPKADAIAGAILRTNAGYDFGAWADAFRLVPELWQANSVLLVNDSVFGPFGDFGKFFARARESKADVVGLTESNEFARHMQSYFTIFKRPALENEKLRRYWRALPNLAAKWEVIRVYEVEMLARYRSYGLTCEGIFASVIDSKEWLNPSETKWRQLAETGFPYIKVGLLRQNARHADLTGWREVVRDPALLAIIDAELGKSRLGELMHASGTGK